MKKFEVVFHDSDFSYDYVTRNMVCEYLQSFFPKAKISVRTVRSEKNESETGKRGRDCRIQRQSLKSGT